MTINLRPHHIERIIQINKANTFQRNLYLFVNQKIYGEQFYINCKNLFQRARFGEDIFVVDGIDDLCRNCPYQVPCSNENYGAIINMLPKLFKILGAYVSDVRLVDNEVKNRLKLSYKSVYTLQGLMELN